MIGRLAERAVAAAEGAAILILMPVLMPVVRQSGIDPVYFGVPFVMNSAIGLLRQPVGTVLNVVCTIAGEDMDQVVRGVMPFLLAELGVLLVLVLVLVTVPLRWLRWSGVVPVEPDDGNAVVGGVPPRDVGVHPLGGRPHHRQVEAQAAGKGLHGPHVLQQLPGVAERRIEGPPVHERPDLL